jgi:chaperonin cofactor prefoldin
MQSLFFIRSCLTRSALLGVLVGTTFVGLCGGGGDAIASQPQIPDPSATVKSDHWTFQSLKSLVERYGCVVNPSGIYFREPSTTPSRYEMAAMVNECLDQIADRFTTPEDRVAALVLFKEFKPEHDVLRARADQLERRTTTLEAQQFPSTTKVIVEPEFYGQFPGLQPTHWSFQAIQSLSMRYHCTPQTSSTLTAQGAATSRYDMAVALNTCLNLIGHRFANQKDLETAQALQKEFKPELTTLKDRVDFLEDRAATLEAQQFSTTTKIQGEAVITFQGGGFR